MPTTYHPPAAMSSPLPPAERDQVARRHSPPLDRYHAPTGRAHHAPTRTRTPSAEPNRQFFMLKFSHFRLLLDKNSDPQHTLLYA